MNELKEYLELKRGIYHTLAFPWMKELTNDWLANFLKFAPVFETMAEGTDNELLLKGCALLKGAPAFIDEEEYAKMFTKIFLGVDFSNRTKSITPHESVYRSPSGLVKQQEWEEVYEIFVQEGIGKNDDFFETEDHISAEMHFLAVLSQQASEAIDKGDKAAAIKKVQVQADFLSNHLNKWHDKLLEHLSQLTNDTIYLAVGYLTAGFIQIDTLYMSEAADMV